MVVGDIMFGEHPLCLGHGVDSMIERNGYNFIFEKIAPILNEANITFCNLENMLLDKVNGKKSTGRFESRYLRGSKECAETLRYAGFNIVNLANNHALQHGIDGLDGTIDLMNQYNIKHIGIKDNNFAVFDFGYIKIGFLGYCSDQQYEKEKIYLEPINLKQISQDIDSLKESGVSFIVVSLHWGDEFVQRPSRKQIEIGRSIIKAGAKLILGHHSHVLQGIERYNNGTIVYSLGNFVSDMQWDTNLKKTMIFSCEISSAGDLKFTVIPIQINRYYQPEIANGKAGNKIAKNVQDLSNYLTDIKNSPYYDYIYSWNVKKRRNINRFEMYGYFILHFHKYKSGIIREILRFFYKKKIDKMIWAGKRIFNRLKAIP